MVYRQYLISTVIAVVSLSVLLIIGVVIIRKCLMNKIPGKFVAVLHLIRFS